MTMTTPHHPTAVQLTRCPECGAPAQIERRTVLESTDGPVEHAKVRCVLRHMFLLPTAALDHVAATAPDTAPRLAAS
jgi:hypothetical protein